MKNVHNIVWYIFELLRLGDFMIWLWSTRNRKEKVKASPPRAPKSRNQMDLGFLSQISLLRTTNVWHLWSDCPVRLSSTIPGVLWTTWKHCPKMRTALMQWLRWIWIWFVRALVASMFFLRVFSFIACKAYGNRLWWVHLFGEKSGPCNC